MIVSWGPLPSEVGRLGINIIANIMNIMVNVKNIMMVMNVN